MKFKSIRGRLQIWYGLILLGVLGGFGFLTYQFQKTLVFARVNEELQQHLGVVLDHFAESHRDEFEFDGPEGRRPRGPQQFDRALNEFGGTNGGAFYYMIWRRDGKLLESSSNAPKTATPAAALGWKSQGTVREVSKVTPPGERILVGRSVKAELNTLRKFGWLMCEVGAVILVLGLAGGWWTTTQALRPIQEMSATAGRIASGDLTQRMDLEEQESELGRLAGVLNATFARLEAAFAQQGQFTADAAHELRTPVTVILTQTELALKRERTAPEYQQTIAACQRAAKRMKRLLETLLELARWDAGEEKLRRESFDLAEVLGNCVELVQPLADAKEIKLEMQLMPVTLVGDPVRLAQVATNLLTNAIQYTQEKGKVMIAMEAKEDWAQFAVSDNGPGIAAEHIGHVFERFYRADAARSSAAGRTGLGLAITQTIVTAHHGKISVESEPGLGTRFKVMLPMR